MNKKFNTQFATQKLRQETSATNFGGATFNPGPGEQAAPVATKKVFKKKAKKEVKDVEPKLAAGKAKIYMKDKWGWKDAPSIPNRPSKGGFIYKQLYEELSQFVKENEPIKELFNIYPESEDQISDPSIKAIYKLLKAVNPGVEKPISLDKSKPKVVKINRKFEKDKKALAALTKLTGKDFESYVELLKTKRGKERYALKVGEKPIWNGITILFGSGAENLPKGSKPFDTAASWRDTRNLALRVGLLREDVIPVQEKDTNFTDKNHLNENYSKFVKENEPVEETLTPEDYKKAKKILDQVKNTNSKLYNAILALASDIYPHDLEGELGADIQAAGLNEGYEHIRYLVADLKNLYHSSNDETFKKAVVDVIPDSDKYTYLMDMPEKYIQKLQNLDKMIPQARLSDPKRASEIIKNAIQFFMDKQALNEGYAQFRNETKTRNKPDQFHQAIRAVKKKVQEINRLFEYVSRLKEELSEGQDGLKYKMHTEKALAKIKEMVSELNQNVKKFK